MAAVLYAPSQVTAKVGDAAEVTIIEKTQYPFDENIVYVGMDNTVTGIKHADLVRTKDIHGKNIKTKAGYFD